VESRRSGLIISSHPWSFRDMHISPTEGKEKYFYLEVYTVVTPLPRVSGLSEVRERGLPMA